MTAKINYDGDVAIVYLAGYLDFESSSAFRHLCLGQLKNRKVVFDFKQLRFVGSCGISNFLETFRDYTEQAAHRPRFSAVGSEFRRLFMASQLVWAEIYENEKDAAVAFVQPPPTAPIMAGEFSLNSDWEEEDGDFSAEAGAEFSGMAIDDGVDRGAEIASVRGPVGQMVTNPISNPSVVMEPVSNSGGPVVETTPALPRFK